MKERVCRMAKMNVTKYGLVGDGKTPNSEALSVLLNDLPDGSTLVFPEGTYYFPTCVEIRGKKKLTIVGEDATLMTHFGPCGDPKENNNLFHFSECEDVTVRDFVVTTDNPIGWAGVVTAVNPEKLYYDVRIYDQFPVTGYEHPVALNSCDADGTPDYVYNDGVWRETAEVDEDGKGKVRYAGFDYEVIGDHLVRFKASSAEKLAKLPVGEQMCYRFIVYGNTHFSFANTHRVLMKNMDVYRASSMAIVISPRCSDFTLDHFNVKPQPGSRELYVANADAVHVLGLCGYLRMKHCEFVGLGDDALNIHGTAGEITGILPDGRLEMQHRHRNGFSPLQGNWAIAGDVIEVYDSATFLRKGTLTVGEFRDGVATVTATTGEYAVGDTLANTAYFAATHISDCTVRNTRARGFLLQTHNVLVEHSYVYGMSLPAIIVSPDIKWWYEVGPSENVVIRNNVFEKCAIIPSGANLGAIVVKGSHDVGAADYPAGVHRNMHILNNRFTNIGNSGIYVSATEGLEIRGNRFEGCCRRRYSPTAYGVRHDIVTMNCNDVTVQENVTTQKEKNLYWAKNCKRVTRD